MIGHITTSRIEGLVGKSVNNPVTQSQDIMHPVRHTFTCCALAAAFGLAGGAATQAQIPIYTDNFDIPDTTSLDGSTQTGRHTGIHANDIVGRSGGIQLTITGGQLNLLAVNPGVAAGRMRFHDAANLANRWDFAAGAGGAAILAAGGFTVSFDWTAANNTSGDWVGFSAGIAANLDVALSVLHAGTDSGIILRNNGGSQLFDNGTSGAGGGGTFDVSSLTRRVDLNYRFSSFADTSMVTFNAYVNGNSVATQTFDWNGNAGVLNLELSSVATGTRIDNFAITVPEPTAGTLLLGGLGMWVAARRSRRAQG